MGSNEDDDISSTLTAKSDQLNADDLIGGPIVVRIEDVSAGDEDQPVIITISGGHQPWKPGKTARRCLAACWGVHARKWIGQSVELYRDASVMFGGEKVGGIRVRAVTGIDKPVEVMLAKTRGKKAPHRIDVLKVEQTKPRTMTQDDAPPPSRADYLTSIRQAVREAGGTMTGLVEFVSQKVGQQVGAPDTWSEENTARVARMVRGEWAADLRTYLAPPMSDNDNPFGGDVA